MSEINYLPPPPELNDEENEQYEAREAKAAKKSRRKKVSQLPDPPRKYTSNLDDYVEQIEWRLSLAKTHPKAVSQQRINTLVEKTEIALGYIAPKTVIVNGNGNTVEKPQDFVERVKILLTRLDRQGLPDWAPPELAQRIINILMTSSEAFYTQDEMLKMFTGQNRRQNL